MPVRIGKRKVWRYMAIRTLLLHVPEPGTNSTENTQSGLAKSTKDSINDR